MNVTPWTLGIDDAAFEQRRPKRGLITKAEVRVLVLAKLNLQPDSVVWDIGTATASVAIEAARLACTGEVWTIEKNAADIAIAERNIDRFGLKERIRLVRGMAPQGLDAWPAPNAVFVGGSGGRLGPILEAACSRLRPGGRIVVNAATLENLHAAVIVLRELGCAVDVTLVQIARSKPVLDLTRFQSLNPVYVVAAEATAATARATSGIANTAVES